MLTLPEVRRRVNAVIADKRDYVYQQPAGIDDCAYFDKDGTPSCLIGCAFEDELRAAGVGPDSDLNTGTGVPALFGGHEIPATPAAVRWLTTVQVNQDEGVSWGAAVAIANRPRR
jgi:hypothetical protein